MKLRNDGIGPAIDWIATLTMPHGSRIYPVDATDGWSDRETPEGWVATWLSRGADDSIGRSLHREILAGPASGSPITIEGGYSIKSAGMGEGTGRFQVSIDAERNQKIDVS